MWPGLSVCVLVWARKGYGLDRVRKGRTLGCACVRVRKGCGMDGKRGVAWTVSGWG